MVPPFVQAVETPIPEFLFIGTIRFISILVITFLHRLCVGVKTGGSRVGGPELCV